MKEIQIPTSLDKKYAILWHDGNDGRLPMILKASWLKPMNGRDKQVYSTAIYMVMNMLAEDGVIKQETIRQVHNKENGWDNQSRITISKVSSFVWLEMGFVIGILLGGGLYLLTALIRWIA